jgi:hypothetical protein
MSTLSLTAKLVIPGRPVPLQRSRTSSGMHALNGLAFTDDSQLTCLSGCHKLPTDGDGPRTVVKLWSATR